MALNRLIARSAGGLNLAAGCWLAGLCAAALAVRIAVAIFLPSIVHQDETFQYLEQGHRLVSGNGLIPWEYVVGARSWLFPGLIAGVIEMARAFGAGPDMAMLCIAVFMAVLSLSTVICGFLWGWRSGGLPAAVAAGTLNAFWFEIVYFSGHTLSEPLAANALAVGLYWVYPGFKQVSKKSLFVGGIFLGLAFILRPQLGPAIAVGVIAICGTEIRARYLPILLGAVLPVIASGVLDALTWDWPFQSLALNVWINVGQGVAAEFSRAPFYQYLSLEVTYWSGAFALIVGLALYAGRRLPALLLVALTIFAVHTALSHKEYRFIYPALPLIMTLVGIGSAGIAQRLRTGVNMRPARVALLLIVPLFWIVTSAILARSREFYPLWFRDRGSIEAMRIVNADAEACGVAIAPADMWGRSGGYAHLRDGVPLYGRTDADPVTSVAAFNYLIAYRPADFSDIGFTKLRCWAEPPGRTIILDPICLWRRRGSCNPAAAEPLTATPPVFLTQAHPEWFAKKN
jgi:hypothetical protein